MDNLLTWNETQKMNITVKPWTDLTPYESTYKQLTFGVISIKTTQTGVPVRILDIKEPVYSDKIVIICIIRKVHEFGAFLSLGITTKT